jgi:hypothetical protein
VSDKVISAMIKTEGRDRYEDDYDSYYDRGYYYHPRPYYSYPYSRLYVGFGYRSGGYYSPYYEGHRRYYSYPRYQPYNETPNSGTTTRYRGSYGTRGGAPRSGSGGATTVIGSAWRMDNTPIAGARVQLRPAHQQVVFDENRVLLLLGDRIAADGQEIIGLDLRLCRPNSRCEKQQREDRDVDAFHLVSV